MKILFLTPQLPYPPHQGTSLRNFGLIKGLAEHGHKITLISFVEPGQPLYTATPLVDLCEHVTTFGAPTRTILERFVDIALGRVDMARRLWSPQFLNLIVEMLSDATFDVVFFEGIEMAAFVEPLLTSTTVLGRKKTKLIYDAHNAEYALQRRIAQQDKQFFSRLPYTIYSLIQSTRLKRFETHICQRVDHIIAVSNADAGMLKALPHHTPVTVVSNAITVDDYIVDQKGIASIVKPSIVFTGKMDYRPNIDAVIWFCRDIFPIVKESVPAAHFTVVGQKPHARLDIVRGQPGVTMTGWVPEIQPYITAADVFVMPLRMGSGTRLKLLEALSMKRAIVSTTIGVEGVDVEHDKHVLIADDEQSFAHAIVKLLQDKEKRIQMGEHASQLVRESYDWKIIIPILEDVLKIT